MKSDELEALKSLVAKVKERLRPTDKIKDISLDLITNQVVYRITLASGETIDFKLGVNEFLKLETPVS